MEATMEKTNPFGSITDMMRQSFEPTRKAMENYLDLLEKNIKASPGLDPELTKKMKSYTEENIAVASEFAQKLTKAKDFQDFWRIQSEFMQAQWKAFNEQTKDLGETMTKGASGVLKELKDLKRHW
jgi:hypothetical protein